MALSVYGPAVPPSGSIRLPRDSPAGMAAHYWRIARYATVALITISVTASSPEVGDLTRTLWRIPPGMAQGVAPLSTISSARLLSMPRGDERHERRPRIAPIEVGSASSALHQL